MHVRFLGKDPDSQEGQSPTLFATDRADRKTYIVQGVGRDRSGGAGGTGRNPAR